MVTQAPPHPDLELDENGKWTFRKLPPYAPPRREFQVKRVKFFASTRECPIHGEQPVTNRNFQPTAMHVTETLSCGHSVAITRESVCFKAVTKYPSHDIRARKFHHWLICFRDTTIAN